MNLLRKSLRLLFVICTLFAIMTVVAGAETITNEIADDAKLESTHQGRTIVASGTFYIPEVTWCFYDDGFMDIQGSGAARFTGSKDPWADFRSEIKEISIGPGIHTIDGSFKDCTGLTSLTIPDTVTHIWGGTLSGCSSLEELTYPDIKFTAGCKYPLGWLFGTTSYEGSVATAQYWYETKNPDKTYSHYAYIPASLRKVTYTGKDLPHGAFTNCKNLTSITLKEGVTVIQKNTFDNCKKLTDVTLPDSLTRIEKEAFQDCESLTRIVFPGSVEYIGSWAFNRCINLKTVHIPATMKDIWSGAFLSCIKISDVYYNGTAEEWNKINFTNSNDYLLEAALHQVYPEPEATFQQTGDESVSVEVKLDSGNETATVLIARYEDGQMTGLYKKSIVGSGVVVTEEIKGSGTEYKAFVLNSSTCMPICVFAEQ